jgi:hypothetical protein
LVLLRRDIITGSKNDCQLAEHPIYLLYDL